MAERERPGEASQASTDAPSASDWSVDGGTSGHHSGVPADGLGDTVVRIPRIGATTPRPGRPGPALPSTRKPKSTGGSVPPNSTAAAATAAGSGAPTVVGPAVAPVGGAAASGVKVPVPADSAKAGKSFVRHTRKARLRLSRVDPWSVLKTVFLFSVSFGVMGWVATYLLWQVLLSSGLFEALNGAIGQLVAGPSNAEGFRIEDYVSANKVLGVAALLAVINTVIATALGTLGAFLYNLSANMLGGLELTLAED